MKKVFISLPVSGQESTLGERYADAVEWLFANYKDESIATVAQSNIQQMIDDMASVPQEEYPKYMGEDIKKVLECDAILMCDGWEYSKGCQVEHKAAVTFGKEIIYKLPMFKNTCRTKIINKSNNPLPKYETVLSAGMDIRAYMEDGADVIVPPHSRVLIHTGLYFALPIGYEAQIRPRSGLSLKKGITVHNAPATLDGDFRGEIGVILFNTTDEDFVVSSGDRIAQIVITEYTHNTWEVVVELPKTERGDGGFGHTEIK